MWIDWTLLITIEVILAYYIYEWVEITIVE